MRLSLHRIGKEILFFLFFSLVTLSSFAQQKTIAGKITEQLTGKPLQDATVNVKGSTQTTISNAEGVFSITVPSFASVLVVSHIGYGTQEIKVGSRSSPSRDEQTFSGLKLLQKFLIVSAA